MSGFHVLTRQKQNKNTSRRPKDFLWVSYFVKSLVFRLYDQQMKPKGDKLWKFPNSDQIRMKL